MIFFHDSNIFICKNCMHKTPNMLGIRNEIGRKLLDFIKENLDKEWNWKEISSNTNITLEIIKANPELHWDWNGISANPNLTMEFIEENVYELNWYNISANPCINIDIIKENPHLPWVWLYVSENPNLTLSFVKENIDRRWNWEKLFYKKNDIFFVIYILDIS